MADMRFVVAAAVALAASTAGCGPIGKAHAPGEEICNALQAELPRAVSGSTELPRVTDADPMKPGLCGTTSTTRVRLHLATGVDEAREVKISGRLLVNIVDGMESARRIRRIASAERGRRIIPLPKLGPDAFVVTNPNARAEPGRTDGVVNGSEVEPASELPLPSTAYWERDGLLFTTSATYAGATAAQSQRITARLAERTNRWPASR